MEVSKQQILSELNELLEEGYNGSFSQMVCDYIHATGMTPQEVKQMLEEMKKGNKPLWVFSP